MKTLLRNWKLDNWLIGHSRRQAGFTLIELIIVMAILAMISAALWGNYLSTITKGRDARRKQDLISISRALEIYYNDNRSYPLGPLPGPGEPLVNPNNSAAIYMQQMPSDPAYPDAVYCYVAEASGKWYRLYANLQNQNDKMAFSTLVLCDTVYYNYGISSANTVP